MDMELCVNSMKIAEVVQLPHHIIAGAIEAKCLHTARIKHCRNPLEKKGLEKQLNKAYKERKKQKHEK